MPNNKKKDVAIKYFLGVSKSQKRINLGIGDKSYWCVLSSQQVNVGDFILLYYSTIGVKQLYKVTELSVTPGHFECDGRMMKTIEIQLANDFSVPITVKQLKAHSILKKMLPVVRNFQGTTFEIKSDEWNELMEILSQGDSTSQKGVNHSSAEI